MYYYLFILDVVILIDTMWTYMQSLTHALFTWIKRWWCLPRVPVREVRRWRRGGRSWSRSSPEGTAGGSPTPEVLRPAATGLRAAWLGGVAQADVQAHEFGLRHIARTKPKAQVLTATYLTLWLWGCDNGKKLHPCMG